MPKCTTEWMAFITLCFGGGDSGGSGSGNDF